MPMSLTEFLAQVAYPRRGLDQVCPVCKQEVLWEPAYGVWSHVALTSCTGANSASFYVPRRESS